MEIQDTAEFIKAQYEALEFTKNAISLDGDVNWQTIYNLKLEVIRLERANQNQRQSYKATIERMEKRHHERIERDKEAQAVLIDSYEQKIDRLAKQIGELTKPSRR